MCRNMYMSQYMHVTAHVCHMVELSNCVTQSHVTLSSCLSVSCPYVVLCLQVSSANGRFGAASAANVSPALLRLQPAGHFQAGGLFRAGGFFRAGGLFQVADHPGSLDEGI